MSSPVDVVVDALSTAGCKPKRSGNGWEARCPAHEDRNPSLSVSEGDDGRVLLHCFTGCEPEAVVASLGLEMRDLMPRDGAPGPTPRPRPKRRETAAMDALRLPTGAPEPTPERMALKELGEPSTVWLYHDTNGSALGFAVARYEVKDGKTIRPWMYDAKRRQWTPGAPKPPRPLYGLEGLGACAEPKVGGDAMHRRAKAGPFSVARVLVVEGEKAADEAAKMFAYLAVAAGAELFQNLAVVTSPGGANAASSADWTPLNGRQVVVWPDADEAGRRYAEDVVTLATSAGAESVSVVRVPKDLPKGWDLADPLPDGWTPERVAEMFEDAEPRVSLAKEPRPILPARRARVEALLSGLEKVGGVTDVEPLLRELADALKGSDTLTVETIKARAVEALNAAKVTRGARLVEAAFDAGAAEAGGEEGGLFLQDTEPWPEPVDGAELLDKLRAAFLRYVVLPDGAAVALALWVVFAHAHDAASMSPILAITSPEKRCGKTLLLDVLGALVPRPLAASSITAATLFRTVEKYRPTLLIDEADTFLADHDDLRGVLNSGHRRSQAWVLRTVGDDHEPKKFSTWCPKALAKIGELPGTLEDRSIVVRMRRRAPGESVERFRLDRDPEKLQPLARQAARWAADNIDALKPADPDVPEDLHDRAADNWRFLLAIAEVAGGGWFERARSAAAEFGARASWSESWGVILLEDIRKLFTERGTDRLTSKEIVEKLVAMEERPWPEYGRSGKPITTRKVAHLLRKFDIVPGTVRISGGGTARGYKLKTFEEAFKRYLPGPDTPSFPIGGGFDPTHRHNATDSVLFSGSTSDTPENDVSDRKSSKRNGDRDCVGVLDREGGVKGKEGICLSLNVEEWPDEARRRLAELEARGMRRAAAVAKIQDEWGRDDLII